MLFRRAATRLMADTLTRLSVSFYPDRVSGFHTEIKSPPLDNVHTHTHKHTYIYKIVSTSGDTYTTTTVIIIIIVRVATVYFIILYIFTTAAANVHHFGRSTENIYIHTVVSFSEKCQFALFAGDLSPSRKLDVVPKMYIYFVCVSVILCLASDPAANRPVVRSNCALGRILSSSIVVVVVVVVVCQLL